MIKKISILISILVIILVGIYFLNQLHTPIRIEEDIINNTVPEFIPLPSKYANQKVPAAPSSFAPPISELDKKVKNVMDEIDKNHADLKILTRNKCEIEIYKSLLASYRLQRYTYFNSTMYCFKNIYKLPDSEFDNYIKLIGAAAHHEKTFTFLKKTYDLSEANLIKKAQLNQKQ